MTATVSYAVQSRSVLQDAETLYINVLQRITKVTLETCLL